MPIKLISTGAVTFLLMLTAAPAQPESEPVTHVQVVNATSVPSISVEVNGIQAYPEFPQGKKTSGGGSTHLDARYKVTDPVSKGAAEASFKYAANQYYTLLITGDFTTDASPQTLPQPNGISAEATEKFKPNVQFRLLENKPLEAGKKPRYRFINAVPRLTMILDNNEILPSNELILEEQPFSASYTALFGTQRITVPMPQEALVRNATIVFYQTKNGIKFLPVLENSQLSEQARAALSSNSNAAR